MIKCYNKQQSQTKIQLTMQFEIQVQQEKTHSINSQKNIKILPDSYIQNEYHPLPADLQSLEEAKILQHVQNVLKTQSLLLQYQQKRKNQRLKEIEYVYTNGFNNFLWEKNKNKNKGLAPMVIINRKDLLQLDDMIPDEIQIFRKCLLKVTMTQIFTIDEKPVQAFLRDFFNFYPKWKTHTSDIIQMQIQKSPKIQNAFESEYTFPSKVLASLKFSANVHMFCTQIFRKPLREIVLYNEELSLDFHHIYEPWLTKIKASADKGQFYNLYQFITRNEKEVRNIKKVKSQLCELMKIKSGESEKLISEMIHFSQNREAIMHLFDQLSSEEIDESINIKLAVLVWKKITANRKKLESIVTLFIDQILNSYYIFPKEVKYIMREYYRIARKKFGEVKYEDVKSFFNKVIYSQLLFPEFMRLLQQDKKIVNQNIKNFNIPIIALLSQKILFGQQFYEKAKYAYFNQLIGHYSQSINNFMLNFLDEIHDYHRLENGQKQIDPMLISFESIAYLYDRMRKVNKVPQLQMLEIKIQKSKSFTFGSTTFQPQDVYLVFINQNNRNYEAVFKPKEKMKRIFIQFLMLIDQIPHPVPLPILLEQYKYALNAMNAKKQVQIHANYLSLVSEQINIKQLADQILRQINSTKQTCQHIKIILQKQYNYAQNIEKVNMKKLKDKRKFNAKSSINDFIIGLMGLPTGFRYAIHDNMVCEVEEGEMETFDKCLKDISEFYMKKLEGYDGLYHLLLEKICQNVEEQGIVLQQTMQATQQIIGGMLYKQLNLDTHRSEEDTKIYHQMLRHYFVNLNLLELSQYSDEEQLIIDSSLSILQGLKEPHSADQLLKIFHEVTIIFQNIILINGKASDITADIQIPMMILILTKSKIQNLASLLNFIEKFCGEDVHSSIMGQTLTLLTSVKYLIQNFSSQQFNISKEEYERLVEQEERRMMAESNREYLIIDNDF